MDAFGLFTAAVPTVEVRTRVTPTIRLATKGGKPSWILELLQPTVVGYSNTGDELFRIAPSGNTENGAGGALALAVAIGVGLLAVFLLGRASK